MKGQIHFKGENLTQYFTGEQKLKEGRGLWGEGSNHDRDSFVI